MSGGNLERAFICPRSSSAKRYVAKLKFNRALKLLEELGQIKALSKLPPDKMVQLIQPEHEADASAGDKIFTQGDEASDMYFIIDGEIDIVMHENNGEAKTVATLGPGEIFGEMGILLGVPRTADAVARTDVRLHKLTKYELDKLSENNPELKTIWSPLYLDAAGGGLMISTMVPIVKDTDQLLGVLGFDVTLDLLTSKLEKDSPVADGYFILINDEGRALALPEKGYVDILNRAREEGEFGPNLSKISSSFSSTIAAMTRNESGFRIVKTNSKDYYVVYKPIANTNWCLGYVVESRQLTKIVTDLGHTLDSSTQSLILKQILPAGILILLLTILLGMRITNRIVNPIQKLSRAAIRLGQGNWDQQLPATKNDEIGILSKAFSKMAGQLKQMMEGLEIRVAERTKELEEANKLVKISEQRLQNELNVARDIQMSMLPLLFPAFPRRTDVDIHADLIPAREVGGDFYDFYFIDENHLCLVIGDVSGKGAPAALMMAVCITLIKSNAKEDMSTASILTQVNNEMAKDNVNAMFVTVFIGILNTNTGEMTYSNAGHNPTFIKRVDGSLTKLTALHGVAIAAMEDLPYKEATISLQQGDVIFAYTDGIPEAHNSKGEMYSDEKLHDLLLEHNFVSAKKITEEIIKSVADFEKGGEQFDDVTALCIQFHGSDEQNLKRELIDIDNNLEEVSGVIAKFEALLRKLSCQIKLQ